MAKIVVIGAGFAGHTAALYLGNALGKSHEVTVINKYDYFLFIPSLVWVGVGRMKPEKTNFKLASVYSRMHINFIHGAATELHPDDQFVVVKRADGAGEERVNYDYLVVATGPKLNFAGTPGLGPDAGHSYSICTLEHAIQARDEYLRMVARMEKGEKVRIVIGTGHPAATCQGAAFEYITNIHKDLVRRGLRDKAELLWLSNEPRLGDFGIRGVIVRKKGKQYTSEDFIRTIFDEFDIRWQVRTGVTAVEAGKIHWEDAEGQQGTTAFDFAVLLPQFLGTDIKIVGKNGENVADKVKNKAGFILVDGIYGLDYPTLKDTPEAWPAVYQNRTYKNIFAAGIAFAPPGPISEPITNPNGMVLSPAPPRTGMISGIIGRIVALNIIDLVKRGRMTHHERMSEMFAACIASMGDSLWDGSAATIVIYPVVPDQRQFPNEEGRDLFVTHMEAGLAGAWMKRLIHVTFMYKFKGLPGWSIIPE